MHTSQYKHPPVKQLFATRSSTMRCFQRGQVAPVVLFGVLVASAVLAMMFNTGQKITERSQVANAADAAAYSGAVWTARHLNFMAYTNRAMIANHAAVGHFIPYVGQYVDVVQAIASQVRGATEQAAKVAVPAIDGWNATFRAAQVEAQASLALDNLNDLMRRTARAYDPAIAVNDAGELSAMPVELRDLIESQLIGQLASVPTFVQRYTPGNDRGSISELIAASLRANNDMQRWISGERGWREDLLAAQVRKQGSTTVTQTDSRADWRASDQLQYRTIGLFGWNRWRRIGTRPSTASATQFDANYSGVPAYYNIAGEPGQRSLNIAAIATKRQSRVATADILGRGAGNGPLAVAAMARVEFRRPANASFAALNRDTAEYANLFNPFWDVRLVPVSSGIDL